MALERQSNRLLDTTTGVDNVNRSDRGAMTNAEPRPRSQINKRSLDYVVRSGIAGGLAGCAAKTVVGPLDRVKILFQASNPQFEKYTGSWFGVFKAMRDINTQAGLQGLFRGHSATLLRIFPYAGIKFLAYEQIRAVIIPTKSHETNIRRFCSGSMAGITSVFFTYPLEVIRVRLAFETKQNSRSSLSRICYQIYYEHPPSCPTSTATGSIIQKATPQAGLANFYRGFSPTLVGMLPYAGMSFLTHDTVEDWLRHPSIAEYTVLKGSAPDGTASKYRARRTQLTAPAELTAGALAGLVSQTASYPLEVIRRRMQVGGATGDGHRLTIKETAKIIWKERGYRGFFVGLTIGYLKVVFNFRTGVILAIQLLLLRAIINVQIALTKLAATWRPVLITSLVAKKTGSEITMEFLPALQQPLDDAKPSLFELIAEAQLNGLLPPSLRYLLALATHRYPRYLLRILNSFDELYALLALIVERHYLKTYGGSFTENFYGLKRERVLRIKGGEAPRASLAAPSLVRETLKLRDVDVWRNLAVMVGIPYLKRKFDESYDIHIAPSASLLTSGGGPQYLDRDALPPNPTLRQRLMYIYKWFLRKIYPSLNAAYYLSILSFSLLYLFDNTKYSTPFLWLISTRMRRLGDADYRAFAAALSTPVPSAQAGRPGQGLAGMLHPRTLWPRLLSSLRFLLPTSVFALKFLEWWHASDFSRQLSRKATESIELPPPIISGPLALVPHTNDTTQMPSSSTNLPSSQRKKTSRPESNPLSNPPISTLSSLPILTLPPPPSSELCPICLHPITNPAACQTGYVFDYTCIFKWIEGTHERQDRFMNGDDIFGGEWTHDEDEDRENEQEQEKLKEDEDGSREGKWENGMGRCAVTGRRVLGGAGGIRRVMV
ncbi:putative mitochondrial carrier protein [Phaeomoniella chlamydospora]|uniref:Peroxisome assembly protein 12 n=1 Tax=Phaeomoniella chlamydospora TaxID=158046 RepID=A0A0G2EWS8_PHACM|nr:putative mitochondrial carrier protein [Phaeomoniella chlamydospora]